MAFEDGQRAGRDFAAIPASDGRFGPDPYRLIALPDARFAALLRGADELVLLDERGAITDSVAAPHDPTDGLWRDGELLVVGTGEARVARFDAALEPLADVELPGVIGPRALTGDARGVWVVDEGRGLGRLTTLSPGPGGVGLEPEPGRTQPYCHGAIALQVVGDLLLGNCLLEHRLRVDRITEDGHIEALEVDGPHHDGPIWSMAIGPETDSGTRLLALTGVEDHALDRSDGAFGYIDSFVFIDELRLDEGAPTFILRASVNTSELGVVTPKWSLWSSDAASGGPSLVVGGYASAELVTLSWPAGLDAAPEVVRRPGLPGTSDAVSLGDGVLLASSPLLDSFVLLRPDGVDVVALPNHGSGNDREFEEWLGEALVFTTAMAPANSAAGRRSRFTCETCHFEGRGDGRVHFTGREFEGRRVHASSRPLLGLFPNRPHFSRALDRDMATMVNNEFRVANRHSNLDPWFTLDKTTLPWLRSLPGWPDDDRVGPERLRRALMRFLMRYSMPSNPATNPKIRGPSASFDPLEARGAELFAHHCEGCHEARLVADDPSTRVSAGPAFAGWAQLIFTPNAPIVWGTSEYAQTGIVPWVHPEGTRVPPLRRLHLKWPYFTNGGADSLEAVLEGVRLGDVAHELGPAADEAQGLGREQREALLAFLRLL